MRYLSEKKARIEIIPMIDIMLFLLVFFAMLMLKMIPTTGQVTKLPTSSTAQELPSPKLLVELKQDGAIWVEQQQLSLPQLTEKLKKMGDKTAVTISGDKEADLQVVMKVLDAIKLSGVTQVAIAAKTQN
ncbi:MAG: biopolymer transporter ExbD [Ferrovum sp. 37-45-19]|uniref:ExbD/TolR family protein n=1 Tax=Ferrovum sp. JA12 TaxID=1356299 RepID=UPI0007036923|nr:biopolymer transporter ExbD [Ferrovum sp. JA12]OYV79468.1 MAG: biopolymer transporter ExbD [Ferrovum sp. 21-44-67]OYV94212.1 MAG: biopolymer transporter ExbD [Ferrovum sp. 37-45-19]OZB31755.1 MAG: biopolymer transporter ExbD [Ferrovum sp. 34-44-207]HQT81684.1 biopolymer transporter ExbD [Ferrovaceae bacterium]KRH78377.1 biopolymer transport protein ExbD [Ferrovum sp. JA12]